MDFQKAGNIKVLKVGLQKNMLVLKLCLYGKMNLYDTYAHNRKGKPIER
jgi:hypothetical protein